MVDCPGADLGDSSVTAPMGQVCPAALDECFAARAFLTIGLRGVGWD